MKEQDGNVTIITALTTVLMFVVIMYATGIGQIAGDASKMQVVSDEAAMTAANAFVAVFNDETVLDVVQWAVDAVKHIGEALEVAGTALVAAGIAASIFFGAGAPLIALGTAIISVGSSILSVGESMSNVVDPIISTIKDILDVAKWVLAITNSTLLAANNGYFGFMLPSPVGAAGGLVLDLNDVKKVADHADAITQDGLVPAYQVACFNNAQQDCSQNTLKDTIRYQALQTLWNDGGATPQQSCTKNGNDPQVCKIVFEPRGHNTFQIYDSATPGCDTSKWQSVGQDPFNGDNVNTDSPDPAKPYKPGLIQRACDSEFKYLKQLMDRPFNDQIVSLKKLQERINLPTRYDAAAGDLGQANSYINNVVDHLKSVVGSAPQNFSQKRFDGTSYSFFTKGQDIVNGLPDLMPLQRVGVPGSVNNQGFADFVYAAYRTTHAYACQGKANTPAPGDNPVTFAKGQTFYGCLTTEPTSPTAQPVTDGTPTASLVVPNQPPYVLKSEDTSKPPKPVYLWWQQPSGVPPDQAGVTFDAQHRLTTDKDAQFDLRHTESWQKNGWLGDYGAKQGSKVFGLAAWVTDSRAPIGHAGQAKETTKNNQIFIEFKQVDPSFQQTLTARLTGAGPPKGVWTLAGSLVDIQRSTEEKDRITFAGICSQVFGGSASDYTTILIIDFPANGATWCKTISDFLFTLASFITNMISPLSDIIEAILGTPPDVKTYHVVLQSFNQVKQLCQAAKIVQQISDAADVISAGIGAIWDYVKQNFTGGINSSAQTDQC